MISVVVPVFNAEAYLRRCIDSILAQSFMDFELLLIDDGSVDGSGIICDEYAVTDSRIRVYHKPNGGVSSARNLGLKYAKGEWIAFIDCDDWVEMEYLFHLNEANVQPCDLVIGGYVEDTGKVYQIENRIYTVDTFEDLINKHRGGGALRTVWGKLFKKSIIDNGGVKFDTAVRAGEDSIFMLQYLCCCNCIKLIDRCEYNYVYDNGACAFGKKYDMSISEIDHAVSQVISAIDKLSRRVRGNIDPLLDIWIFTGMFQIINIKSRQDLRDYYLLCVKYVPGLDEASFYKEERFSPVLRGLALLKSLYEENNFVDAKELMKALYRLSTYSQTSLRDYKYKDFQVWYYFCRCQRYKMLDLLLRLYVLMKRMLR